MLYISRINTDSAYMEVTMSEIHFYVPDDVEMQIRSKAKAANLSLSKYLAELVKRESAIPTDWSADYLALFDDWHGEAEVRPAGLNIEQRQGFN
jgi:hypothetical protein